MIRSGHPQVEVKVTERTLWHLPQYHLCCPHLVDCLLHRPWQAHPSAGHLVNPHACAAVGFWGKEALKVQQPAAEESWGYPAPSHGVLACSWGYTAGSHKASPWDRLSRRQRSPRDAHARTAAALMPQGLWHAVLVRVPRKLLGVKLTALDSLLDLLFLERCVA